MIDVLENLSELGAVAIAALLLAILLLVPLRPIAPARRQDDPMQEAHGDLPLLPPDARSGGATP